MLRVADGARQRHLRQVIVEDRADVVVVRRYYRLLRLHYFDGVGYAVDKAVARLAKRVFGQIYIASRYIHLIGRRAQIDVRLTDVLVYASGMSAASAWRWRSAASACSTSPRTRPP